MMWRGRLAVVGFLAAWAALAFFQSPVRAQGAPPSARPSGRGPTLAERETAHRAVEQFYHARRVKGPVNFDAVSAAAAQRARETLAMNVLLEQRYGVTLTDAMLRAETERMARDTMAPEALRELFTVLGNNPRKVKETLARPALVERFLRSRYAYDAEIHGALRAEVHALRGRLTASNFRELAGEDNYFRTVIRVGDPTDSRLVDARNFERYVDAATLENLSRDVPPQGVIRDVAEKEDTIYVQRFAPGTGGALEVETLHRLKKPFEIWLMEVSPEETELDSWSPAFESSDSFGSGTRLPDIKGVVPATACSGDSWAHFGPPEPRFGHTIVWTGTEMIVWGGYNGNFVFFQSGYRYDPAVQYWKPISAVNGAGAPEGRFHHSAVWTGTEMIVWGGHNGFTTLQSGGRYNPATDSWSAISETNGSGAPESRLGHSAVWADNVNRMVVWGGWKSIGGSERQDGGLYDPANNSWSAMPVTADTPAARLAHTTVWTGTEMIVWGGYATATSQVFGNGGRYNPALGSWQPVNMTNAPSARQAHMATWTAGAATPEMVVWGGNALVPSPTVQTLLHTGAHYDPSTDTWTKATSTSFGSAFTGGDPSPEARRRDAAIFWAPEIGRILIWGGAISTMDSMDGGIYNPTTASWTGNITSSSGDAPPRRHVRGAWTGTQMLIWGGASSSSAPMDEGHAFTPSTTALNPIPLNEAPRPRHSHSSVWSGTEMIVWGGMELDTLGVESGITGSGGRFNPITGTWSPIAGVFTRLCRDVCGVTECRNNNGAPGINRVYSGGRTGHTATWDATSGQMIVVGGIEQLVNAPTGVNPPFDGWIYHYTPATNAWLLPKGYIVANYCNSTVGSLPATSIGVHSGLIDAGRRVEHGAVWTGKTLLFSHGWLPFDFTHKTDLQEIRTNASGGCGCRARSATGLPSARYGHATIWDPVNSKMLVWGGNSQAPDYTFRSDGAAYTPLTSNVYTYSGAISIASTNTTNFTLTVPDTGTISSVTAIVRLTPPTRNTPNFNVTLIAPNGTPQELYNGCRGAWAGTPGTNGAFGPHGTFNGSAMNGTWTLRVVHTSAACTPCQTSGACTATTAGSLQEFSLDIEYAGAPGNTWTALPTLDAPSARSHMSSVWAGDRMLLWGGRCGSGCARADGGEYIPATNSWANIPAGPLSARYFNSAVWSEDEMLVWGGYDVATGQFMRDGAGYTSGGGWTSMTMTDAPLGRYRHTAEWTTGLNADATPNPQNSGFDAPAMLVWGGWVEGTVASSVGSVYWPACSGANGGGPIGSEVGLGFGETGHLSVAPGESPDEARLTWSPSCTDANFAVYRGNLELLRLTGVYNHAPSACSTGGGAVYNVTDDARTRTFYYLVAPHGDGEEGSKGRDSAGFERPVGLTDCYPQNISHCP